jgi:hypothetical protein
MQYTALPCIDTTRRARDGEQLICTQFLLFHSKYGPITRWRKSILFGTLLVLAGRAGQIPGVLSGGWPTEDVKAFVRPSDLGNDFQFNLRSSFEGALPFQFSRVRAVCVPFASPGRRDRGNT